MELSVAPFFRTGVAMTIAGAIAFSPVMTTAQHHPLVIPMHLPRVTTSEVQLAGVISPQDVAALTANLHAALDSAGSTVAAVVEGTSQTLTGALDTAAALSTSLWDQLIAAAGNSPTLAAVLVALKASSGGALLQLSDTVRGAGDAIALTTGQVAELLTSTVTGTVGTAVQAVTDVVNNPLSASSYLGLLNTPFGLAGLALQSGIAGISQLGASGLQLGNGLVHGVTDQVSNVLGAVNGLLDAGKTITDIALINGTLTAIQGIVSAPVNAVLAGVDGVASAVANAGVATLENLAGGANTVVGTWLGDGSAPGAIINAASAIGAEPLSPASYTHAVAILVGAGTATFASVVDTAGAFASLPFRVGADLTGTGAAVVNALVVGVAAAASGLLEAAGLSPLIAGLPNNLAAVVTTAINTAALATQATLDTIATAIDIGHAVTGFATPSTATATITLSPAKSNPARLAVRDVVDNGPDPSLVTDRGPGATAPTPAPPSQTPVNVSGGHDLDDAPTPRSPVTGAPQAATPTKAPDSDTGARDGTEPPKAADVSDGTTAKTKLSGGDPEATAPTRSSADAYGRHAASTGSKTGSATAADSAAEGAPSSSGEGGRHRRRAAADDAAHEGTAGNGGNAAAPARSPLGGGRHAATGEHAAAAAA